jgi:hypothetical protein
MVAGVLLSNLSLPYWSIAGLETSAFACMALAALVAEYHRPQRTFAFLILASLLRPEGVVVFSIVFLYRFIAQRKIDWQFLLFYTIALIPFALFKLLYYGSLFPNSYFAKSGVGWEYIQSGSEYVWFFARTLGVYGMVFLIPLLLVKKLWNKYSLLYLYVFIYSLYIIWVGGDVLRVYRFFVPVVPVLSYLFVISLAEMFSLIRKNRIQAYLLTLVCAGGFSFLSYSFSQEYIRRSRDLENDITDKMSLLSTKLKKYKGSDFSIAATTIGKAGYQLMGNRVIDMLGLTDAYIAHHPEHVRGMNFAWKERRYNSQYLLEQQPDFIFFSTDFKPSAPAEQALMLHSEFRKKYKFLGFPWKAGIAIIWERKEKLELSKDVVCPDFKFVDKFCEACLYFVQNAPSKALASFQESQQRLGEEYAVIGTLKGWSFWALGMNDSAKIYFNKAIALDSLDWEARRGLLMIAQKKGDQTSYLYQINTLQRQSPWLFEKD